MSYISDPRLSWYCEPSQWETGEAADDALVLTTDSDTDYRQRTHYGFRRDNGEHPRNDCVNNTLRPARTLAPD